MLPARQRLNLHKADPIRLTSFQVGPTAHVLEQSPLASALWHPLSPTGNTLITVTKDACVRLWELDSRNRSTFNEPALAVDLRKLGNASSVAEDFSASKYGTNRGYSPDDVEMQVAASCFGGQGYDDEEGWSSMTLWVAMTEGDVYALCPFLPSKFRAPATLLPSLSTSVVASRKALEFTQDIPETQRRIADDQAKWLGLLDAQEPMPRPGDLDNIDVYFRPDKPSAIPRLQGPFQISPEPDFGEVTDIHVVAPKLDIDELFDDEEDKDDVGLGDELSIGIVCLATNTSKVHVCLNITGVEAEWLHERTWIHFQDGNINENDLLLFETVDLALQGQSTSARCWPSFTPSPLDRYEIFSTQPTGLYSISFRPWIQSLENEISASQIETEGVGFRFDVMLESASTAVEILTSEPSEPYPTINAAIVVSDVLESDLGHVVLTAAMNMPVAAVMDVPWNTSNPFAPDTAISTLALQVPEPRAPYQPVEAFFQRSALPAQLEAWTRESVNTPGANIKGEIRFSSYTLERITETHRILSSETHKIGIAVADLFRQCQRMVSEMKSEVERVRTLSDRIDGVTGDNEFPDRIEGQPEPVRGGRRKIQDRIQNSKDKTVELHERVEQLRRKMRSVGGQPFSARERAFVDEVALLNQSLNPPSRVPTSPTALVQMENSDITTTTMESDAPSEDPDSLSSRFDAVRHLHDALQQQAIDLQRSLETQTIEPSSPRKSTTAGSVPGTEFRKQKLAQVMTLLERQTALVDAVATRLQRLQTAANS